jgi:hypothetical protein
VHHDYHRRRIPSDVRILCRIFTKFREKKRRSVQDALDNDNWIRGLDINGRITNDRLTSFVLLWTLVQSATLQPGTEDTIKWKLTKSGVYTAASAYKAQFLGCTTTPPINSIWKTWAPPKCKFFAWLITQNRVWSTNRLAARWWPHNDSYVLCVTPHVFN